MTRYLHVSDIRIFGYRQFTMALRGSMGECAALLASEEGDDRAHGQEPYL